MSWDPHAFWCQLMESQLQLWQPVAVNVLAGSEAIDALSGTKRRSPRVVPDETKSAVAGCASRGPGVSIDFGAIWHLVFSCRDMQLGAIAIEAQLYLGKFA